jgi:hypothetical protein
MEVGGELHAQAALPAVERAPGTHWIGGWVGPRAGLDAVAKRKFRAPVENRIPLRPARRLVTIPTELSRIAVFVRSFLIFIPRRRSYRSKASLSVGSLAFWQPVFECRYVKWVGYTK